MWLYQLSFSLIDIYEIALKLKLQFLFEETFSCLVYICYFFSEYSTYLVQKEKNKEGDKNGHMNEEEK